MAIPGEAPQARKLQGHICKPACLAGHTGSMAYAKGCKRDLTPWACTYHFLGVPFGITIPLPTADHDEAERLVRTTWPGVRVAGRLLEEVPAYAKQKG